MMISSVYIHGNDISAVSDQKKDDKN